MISLPFAFYLENLVLIVVVSLLGHFLADTLLHWNLYPDHFTRYPYELVALDIIAGLVAAWLLVGNQFLTAPVLLAIAAGNAPDVAHGLWDMFGKKYARAHVRFVVPYFRWHEHIQYETTSMWRGLVSQFCLILLALLSLLPLAR